MFTANTTYAQVSSNYWKLLSGTLQPNISTWTLTLPFLGSTGNPCVSVGTGGLLATTTCGSGGGTGVATTSLLANYPITVTKTSASITYGTALSTSTATINAPLSGTLTTLGASNSLSISQANTSTNGYLSSTDWNTFNNKQYSFATSTLTAGSGLTGSFVQVGTGGSLSLNNTGNWAGTWQTYSPSHFQAAGTYVTSVGGTWPVLSSGGITPTISWGGLATTSQPSSSNLLVSNGVNGIYGAATSTLSATSPLTGSFTQIGSGGSLGCQTASGSQAGCLSSTDWTTFNNKGSVTSVAMSVPTGLAISGSPITTSGTLALTYASGYAAVKTASTTNWNGFYDTPSTRITAGTNLSWSGNTLNATGGGTFAWTPTTNYGAAANSTSTPIWFKSGIMASTTANYFAGLTIDNGSASNAWATYGKSGHEWSEGYNATGNYFEISSSTALGTSDVFKADKSLNVFLPSLSTNGLVKTSGGTGQLSIATNGTDYTLLTAITCTNQVLTAFTAAGVGTCSTVSNAMLANSTISGISLGSNLADLTATNGTLTFSGTYNGSTARTIGLNLGNANTWTALQTFGNSTTSLASFTYASSTKAIFGEVGIASSTPNYPLSILTGAVAFAVKTAGEIFGYDTIYSHTGQLNPMRPISTDLATTTTWTGTSTTASVYMDMTAMVAPWTGTFTKASCFTNAGTLTVELTSGSNHAYLPNASTTAGINTFSLSMTKGDKMYLQAGNPATSPQRVNCTFMGYITP